MRFFITFLFLLFCFCTKTPEKLLEKAKQSLAQEDIQKALEYIREAYDLSLPSEYFFISPKAQFTLLRTSQPAKKILLVKKKNPKKVLLYNSQAEVIEEISLPNPVEEVAFSPLGNYLIFLLRKKESCVLFVYSFEENKKYPLPWEGDCCFRPAILEEGIIPFFEEGRIWFYELKTNLKTFLNEKPDPPVGKLPLCAAFWASPQGELYFTYGRGGLYKGYQVEKKGKFKLLRKDLASPQLFFSKNGLALITGGAGEWQLFYIEGSKSVTLKLPYVDQLFFLDEKHYFYRQGYHLYEVKNGQKKEIPFWVEDAAYLDHGLWLFLTPSKRLIKYIGEPPALSLAIFQKGSEMDEVY